MPVALGSPTIGGWIACYAHANIDILDLVGWYVHIATDSSQLGVGDVDELPIGGQLSLQGLGIACPADDHGRSELLTVHC